MKIFRKLLPNKSLVTILSIGVLIFFAQSHAAHASWFGIASIAVGVINEAVATLVTLAQYVVSLFIMFTGLLLNFSVNLTLHIKEFVNDAPAIFATWKALRDITGLFIIFGLLYAAIQLITGIKKPNFNDLIKNIVLAGVLINFSFFFAGLGIDLSNMVSVQLYNAIAPKSSLNATNLTPDKIGEVAIDGGLSEIFMNAMKMPKFITADGAAKATTEGSFTMTRIMMVGAVNIVVMLIAGCSFIVASLMFIFRFVILIFLLAFSPIWFMSFILPDLKKYSDDWIKYYKSMLLIMPVYFILLYMSLNVLTNTKYFASNDSETTKTVAYDGDSNSLISSVVAATTSGDTESRWYTQLLGLAVNAVLVIFMMNVPLLGAMSVGGKLAEMVPGSKALSGAGVLSFVGRNIAGRAADYASNSSRMRSFYRSAPPIVGNAVNKGFKKISGADWGGGKDASYDAAKKQKIKDYSDLAKKSNFTEEEAERIATTEIASGSGSSDEYKAYKLAEQQNTQHKLEIEQAKRDLESHKNKLNNTPRTRTEKYVQQLATVKRAEEALATKMETAEGSSKQLKKAFEAFTKEVKERPQNEAIKQYMGPDLISKIPGGKFINKISGGRVGGSTAHSLSTNKAIADAIRGKDKSEGDKLLEKLKKQIKEEEEKSGSSKPKSEDKPKTT